MYRRNPDATLVHISLLNLLRQNGARAVALIDCRLRPAISFPTYVITAAGETKMKLAAILEQILQREFDAREGRWVLEAEEARSLTNTLYATA
ncbi:MAG TPA: hypothetical protein VFB54_02595 [Burkholderiales bacterium]|nr:hypothetical protein [Burkholderiales bacterium]